MGVYKPALRCLALCLLSRQGAAPQLPLPPLSPACSAGNSPRLGSDAFLPVLLSFPAEHWWALQSCWVPLWLKLTAARPLGDVNDALGGQSGWWKIDGFGSVGNTGAADREGENVKRVSQQGEWLTLAQTLEYRGHIPSSLLRAVQPATERQMWTQV